MLVPGLETQLGKIPSFCKKSNLNSQLTSATLCSNFVGSFAVYRLSLGVTVFFVLMSLLVSSKGRNDEENYLYSDDQSEILQ